MVVDGRRRTGLQPPIEFTILVEERDVGIGRILRRIVVRRHWRGRNNHGTPPLFFSVAPKEKDYAKPLGSVKAALKQST